MRIVLTILLALVVLIATGLYTVAAVARLALS